MCIENGVISLLNPSGVCRYVVLQSLVFYLFRPAGETKEVFYMRFLYTCHPAGVEVIQNIVYFLKLTHKGFAALYPTNIYIGSYSKTHNYLYTAVGSVS